jgi:type III pantothenate kinase
VTPDVVVDIGNSRIKFGYPSCTGGDELSVGSLGLGETASWESLLDKQRDVLGWSGPVSWAVASVNPPQCEVFLNWARSRGETVTVIDDYRRLPLTVDVDEPGKVGIDRLLAAAAARRRVPDGGPVVIIGVGSAVTVDLLDDRDRFRGGAIFPGPRLMAAALHRFTAKVPDVPIDMVPSLDPPGRNTEDAIAVGIMAAVMGGCHVLVTEYAALSGRPPRVLLSGGAVGHLVDYHFGRDIEVAGPYPLTLEGVRLAAEALP